MLVLVVYMVFKDVLDVISSFKTDTYSLDKSVSARIMLCTVECKLIQVGFHRPFAIKTTVMSAVNRKEPKNGISLHLPLNSLFTSARRFNSNRQLYN